jgi:hypothetical protein
VGGNHDQWHGVVITSNGGMARLLQARAGLGSKHTGQRRDGTSPWRGLGSWSAQVAASQDLAVHRREGEEEVLQGFLIRATSVSGCVGDLEEAREPIGGRA